MSHENPARLHAQLMDYYGHAYRLHEADKRAYADEQAERERLDRLDMIHEMKYDESEGTR